MSDDRELLSILQAHGQRFLQSFTLPTNNTNKRKCEEDNSDRSIKKSRSADDSQDDEYEEWMGISGTALEGRDNLSDIGILHISILAP